MKSLLEIFFVKRERTNVDRKLAKCGPIILKHQPNLLWEVHDLRLNWAEHSSTLHLPLGLGKAHQFRLKQNSSPYHRNSRNTLPFSRIFKFPPWLQKQWLLQNRPGYVFSCSALFSWHFQFFPPLPSPMDLLWVRSLPKLCSYESWNLGF